MHREDSSAAPGAWLGPDVIAWLLDSDPGIRWQVLRDLLQSPAREIQAERAQVASRGWGARLMALVDPDGQWAGGSFTPAGFTPELWRVEGQPWTSTHWVLSALRELGLPPEGEGIRRIIEQLGSSCFWDHAGEPFWDGEVEECINGRHLSDGVYFGQDMRPLVHRLLSEQQREGGWNCERAQGSVRASFDTTINVLEGLLAAEHAGQGGGESRAARRAAEEFLLERELFRRRSTGDVADPRFLELKYPYRAVYSTLRALEYFRAAAALDHCTPDPRLAPAIRILISRQLPEGAWPSDGGRAGRQWFGVEEAAPGRPSRWITLRAARVLGWWDAQARG